MSLLDLPRECLLNILFYIHISSPFHHLLPALLTSKALYGLGIKVIYSSVSVLKADNAGRLIRTLVSTPYLSHHVRRLTIKLGTLDHEDLRVWHHPAVSGAIIKSIFQACKNIKSLSVGGIHPNSLLGVNHWANTQELEQLEVDGWVFRHANMILIKPATLFSIFRLPNLRTLRLHCLVTSYSSPTVFPPSPKPFPPLKLQSLKFELDVPFSIDDFEMLGKLCLLTDLWLQACWNSFNNPGSAFSEPLRVFLKNQSKSLERLTLKRGRVFIFPNNFLMDNIIGEMQNLKFLSLDHHLISDLGIEAILASQIELVSLDMCINFLNHTKFIKLLEKMRKSLKSVKVWGAFWDEREKSKVIETGQRLGLNIEISVRDASLKVFH